MEFLRVFTYDVLSISSKEKEGRLFYMYLVLYGMGRVVIEGFRMDSQMLLNTNIRVNQLIALIILIVGIVMLAFSRNANEYQVIDEDNPIDHEEEQKEDVKTKR